MKSKIFITGDTHIPIDIHKLSSSSNTLKNKNLTKNDFVIILGDFGLLWNHKETGKSVESNSNDIFWSKEELYWKEWLENKPWTTLFIDGNHENFNRLNSYPITKWNGGKVHKISDSIIHLMRGQYFDIDGISFFTMGGANSSDRGPATHSEEKDINTIWWPQEKISPSENIEALENLKQHGNTVDVVLSHEAPYSIRMKLNLFSNDDVSMYLQYIMDNIEYKQWFSGHHHCSYRIYSKKYTILYNEVIDLGDYIK